MANFRLAGIGYGLLQPSPFCHKTHSKPSEQRITSERRKASNVFYCMHFFSEDWNCFNFQDCLVEKIQVTGQSLLFSSQTQCSDVNQCPRPWLVSLFVQVIENPHLQKTGVPSYQKYYQFIFPSLSSRKLIFPVLSGTSLGRCQLVSPFSFAKPGHSKLLEMAKSILFGRKPINFPNQISSRI